MKRFVKTANLVRSAGVRLGTGALYYSGGLTLLRAGFPHANGHATGPFPFAILLYHRVNPDEDPFFPAVSVNVFEAQMGYLAREFQVLSLADIIDRMQQGKGVEPLTIAITFDDGYRDNYTFAHPIIKKYRLPATLFVATGFIGTGLLMWNDRLAWAVKNSQQKRIVCQFGQRELPLSLSTEEDKLGSLDTMLEELKPLPEAEKQKLLENIIEALQNKKPQPAELMLDWLSIRNMAKEGWDIGSHTVSHQILTKVDRSRAAEELKVSKEAIEDKLQRTVKLCAFPNGKRTDFDSSTKVTVKELGYQGAVTTLAGINGRDLDFYELRRWSVWENYLPTLACKLSYSYRRANYETDS
jgi:peptidoglycan/xylan/chitin deacetylase (PgdA/CDA1 family)